MQNVSLMAVNRTVQEETSPMFLYAYNVKQKEAKVPIT